MDVIGVGGILQIRRSKKNSSYKLNKTRFFEKNLSFSLFYVINKINGLDRGRDGIRNLWMVGVVR